MKKTSDFKPAWWLTNPHLQTVWSSFIRSKAELPFTRENFELSDGDFLDIRWLKGGQGPIVIVLHGLCGSIDSPYALGILDSVQKSGWRGVLMHFRGCGDEHNRLERSYHAGDTIDIGEFVAHVQEQHPGVPIAAVGYSLGGNVLLKWLGESGEKNPLTAAIAISVPFDLTKVLERLNTGLSRFYSQHLLKNMRDFVVDKYEERGEASVDLDVIKKAKTFPEFDAVYTAPVHGFDSPYDYYQRASCRHYLKGIEVPTLVLHSEDDPLMTQDSVPDDNQLSDAITLEVSSQGGHVGFVQGKWPWRAEYWLEKRIPEFLKQWIET